MVLGRTSLQNCRERNFRENIGAMLKKCQDEIGTNRTREPAAGEPVTANITPALNRLVQPVDLTCVVVRGYSVGMDESHVAASTPPVANRVVPVPHSGLDTWLRYYNSFVILLLLYVLSTGPMYWLIHRAYFNVGGARFIAAFYYPIAWLCEFEPVSRWFDWYIGLWVY